MQINWYSRLIKGPFQFLKSGLEFCLMLKNIFFFFSELSLDFEGPVLTSGHGHPSLFRKFSGSAENLSGFHSQQSMQ